MTENTNVENTNVAAVVEQASSALEQLSGMLNTEAPASTPVADQPGKGKGKGKKKADAQATEAPAKKGRKATPKGDHVQGNGRTRYGKDGRDQFNCNYNSAAGRVNAYLLDHVGKEVSFAEVAGAVDCPGAAWVKLHCISHQSKGEPFKVNGEKGTVKLTTAKPPSPEIRTGRKPAEKPATEQAASEAPATEQAS